jgi:hypothetical protein
MVKYLNLGCLPVAQLYWQGAERSATHAARRDLADLGLGGVGDIGGRLEVKAWGAVCCGGLPRRRLASYRWIAG